MDFRNYKPIFEPLHSVVWLDQLAHFLVGLILATIGVYFFHPLIAIIITMLIAGIREMIQHPLQCHAGCRTDLLFWLMGSCMVPIILIVGGK